MIMEAMVRSAIDSAELAREYGMPDDRLSSVRKSPEFRI